MGYRSTLLFLSVLALPIARSQTTRAQIVGAQTTSDSTSAASSQPPSLFQPSRQTASDDSATLVARSDTARMFDSLTKEMARLRAGRLRDSLEAQSEIELSTSGIRLKGLSIWLALLLLVGAVTAFLVARSSVKASVANSFGIGAIALLAVGAFLAGGWWTRRSSNEQLLEMNRYYDVSAPWLAPTTGSVSTLRPPQPPSDSVRASAPTSEPLFTRTMLWVVIIATIVLGAFVAFLYSERLRISSYVPPDRYRMP